MRITECYIQGFGRLRDEHYVFRAGLNPMLADNGTGKSTLAAFIHAMLYGLSDTKKVSLDENDRKKYAPWSGGVFGGSLTLEARGKKYRIERTFGKRSSEDTFSLFDAMSGRASSDLGECVGEELFGIDADGFLRTVFLSEKSLSEKNENKSIGAKLSGASGTVADIGELDSALAALEERRRFYYKKGGAGVISDKKASIAALDAEILALRKKAEGLGSAEKELALLKAELDAAKKERDELTKRCSEIELERHTREYRSQYDNMLRSLSIAEEKYKQLGEFFKNGVPSYREIDENREKYGELRRMEREGDFGAGVSPELIRLREFFNGGTCAEEIERMSDLAEMNKKAAQRPALFSCRIPEDGEIEDELARLKRARSRRRRARLSLLPVLIGTGGAAASLLLGRESSYSLPLLIASVAAFLIGALLFFTSKAAKRLKSAEDSAARLILSLSGQAADGDLVKKLKEMKTALDGAPSSAEASSENAMREIYEFLGRFPLTDASTPEDAVNAIKAKYRRLEALEAAEAELRRSSAQRRAAGIAEIEEAKSFLSRYATASDSPFDEIRDRLTEYTALGEAIAAKRREIESFARLCGTGSRSKDGTLPSPEALDGMKRRSEERISELSRRVAIIERTLDADTSDTERIDSLAAKRDALLAEADRYEKNLYIIQKTKKYLTDAHEAMTKRYLGKMKKYFDGYISAIGGAAGDFAIDTDLTLTRYDGASARRSESYSKGTRELYALAVRLALTDALFEEDEPFIILDDPFTSFDDKSVERAKAAVRELAKTRQIIYFTCSASRAM